MADVICELIESGFTTREIDGMPDLPSWPTVCRWMKADDAFRKRYAHARELSAEAFENEGIKELREAKTLEQVQRARALLDGIKWVTAKRNPTVYGDKTTIEHTGDLNVHHAAIADVLGAATRLKLTAPDEGKSEE